MRIGSTLLFLILSTFLAGLSTMGTAGTAEALPRMSATAGSPCSTCHYNSDGGGLRSEIGWGTQWMTGAFDHEQTGLGFLYEQDTNQVLDWLAVGGDMRIQMARLGEPTASLNDSGEQVVEAPTRRVIPMQLQPYVALMPFDFLTVQGSYAIGPDIVRGELCSTPYAGQTCWQAHASLDFDPNWPTLRLGRFRPSMGMRHDDHTMLTYLDASRSRGFLIPPNYAEYGAELNYQPRSWLKADAGVFLSQQLADSVADEDLVDPLSPAYLGRLTYLPRFDIGGSASFYGWLGASVYGSGQFRMDQAFLGLGWLDKASLQLELTHLDYGSSQERRGINTSAMLSVPIRDWFVADARVEQALMVADDDARHQAAVLGLQFYPVPFVKLRPEYRINRSDDWTMGQYTVQLHLFY